MTSIHKLTHEKKLLRTKRMMAFDFYMKICHYVFTSENVSIRVKIITSLIERRTSSNAYRSSVSITYPVVVRLGNVSPVFQPELDSTKRTLSVRSSKLKERILE